MIVQSNLRVWQTHAGLLMRDRVFMRDPFIALYADTMIVKRLLAVPHNYVFLQWSLTPFKTSASLLFPCRLATAKFTPSCLYFPLWENKGVSQWLRVRCRFLHHHSDARKLLLNCARSTESGRGNEVFRLDLIPRLLRLLASRLVMKLKSRR